MYFNALIRVRNGNLNLIHIFTLTLNQTRNVFFSAIFKYTKNFIPFLYFVITQVIEFLM